MTHSYVIHASLVCVTWLICEYDMTHSFVCAAGLTRVRDMTHIFICVTWLIRLCRMPHSCVCDDSFVCATWLIILRDMSYLYVSRDSFECVACLLWTCGMPYSYVRHASCIPVTHVSLSLATYVSWVILSRARVSLSLVCVSFSQARARIHKFCKKQPTYFEGDPYVLKTGMFIPILIPMHHPNFDDLHFSNVEEPHFYQKEPNILKNPMYSGDRCHSTCLADCRTLPASHGSTLQNTATLWHASRPSRKSCSHPTYIAGCNILQHVATYSNTLQHIDMSLAYLPHLDLYIAPTATHCKTLRHITDDVSANLSLPNSL